MSAFPATDNADTRTMNTKPELRYSRAGSKNSKPKSAHLKKNKARQVYPFRHRRASWADHRVQVIRVGNPLGCPLGYPPARLVRHRRTEEHSPQQRRPITQSSRDSPRSRPHHPAHLELSRIHQGRRGHHPIKPINYWRFSFREAPSVGSSFIPGGLYRASNLMLLSL